MDAVLIAGLEGIQDVTFNVYVPQGSSGYYNVRKHRRWWRAFEQRSNSDGTVRYAVDPQAGGPEFTTTYNNGLIEIKHEIDTDTDLMNILIDGLCGRTSIRGDQIGAEFYAAGDGGTLPLYFVDDISVSTLRSARLWHGRRGGDAHGNGVWTQPAKDNSASKANFDQAMVRILALNGQVVFEDMRTDLRGGSDIDLGLTTAFTSSRSATALSVQPSAWWCRSEVFICT